MSHYGNRYNNNNPNFQNRKRKTDDSHYDGTIQIQILKHFFSILNSSFNLDDYKKQRLNSDSNAPAEDDLELIMLRLAEPGDSPVINSFLNPIFPVI